MEKNGTACCGTKKSFTSRKIYARLKARSRRLFEVVNFVRTTRRWYDRGNPRDAGESDACQIIVCHAEKYSHPCGYFFYFAAICASCANGSAALFELASWKGQQRSTPANRAAPLACALGAFSHTTFSPISCALRACFLERSAVCRGSVRIASCERRSRREGRL